MTAPIPTLRQPRYRADRLIEWRLGKRGRENAALALLAAGCVAGIVILGRA